MRPMCETRKRRHSDPQLLANKRLTNGKTDHVTTRSQAKNDPSARVSPARKVKHKVLSTEERRLMISMRLRHEERNTTQANLTNHQSLEEVSRRHLKSSNRLHALNGGGAGKSNGLTSSPVKSSSIIRAAKLRAKVLCSQSTNEPQNEILSKSVQDVVALKRATEAEKRETRAKKRRSALWVLNCEAEEFLFGETAAEDQEVELPPMSSPPTKRRRMRATELGDLLKETPLLGSKLRHPPGFSESDEEVSTATSSSTSCNKKRKEKKSRGTRTKNSTRVKRKLDVGASGSISFEPEDPCESTDENGSSSSSEFPNLSYALMLEVARDTGMASSSTFRDSSEQSVRIQRILNSLEFTFSFENVPSSEVWYRTFCHQDRPRHFTFHSTTPSSVILPYEVKGLNRESKKRLRRPPRKSPRCHASTQAILSLLKPGRGRRSSGPPISPNSPQVQPPLPPPSSKSKPIASHIPETPIFNHHPLSSASSSSSSTRFITSLGSHLLATTKMFIPPPQSSPSLIVPNGIENGIKACDMSATQYLWDSIQFLSDPYVIHVLSLSSTERSGKGRCPILNKVTATPEKNWTGNSKQRVNHNNNVKTPLKLVIPSPKTSPRFLSPKSSPRLLLSPTNSTGQQNGNCSKAEVRRVLRSPQASPPPPPPESLSPVRKTPRVRKSSGLLVETSPVTNHVKHPGSKFKPGTAKLSPFPVFPVPVTMSTEEEVLFSQDSLPDFPWETFNN